MSPLQELLKTYQPFNNLEAAHVRQLNQFLQESPNAYSRSNLVAHVVADAWIVNPQRTHILMVEHTLSNCWCAPGRHCDGSPDIRSVAIREVEEETGVKFSSLKPLLGGGLYDVNAAIVPNRETRHGFEPTHMHFDVCFAFEADMDTPLLISDESTNLKWQSLSNLDSLEIIPSHRRRWEKMPEVLHA